MHNAAEKILRLVKTGEEPESGLTENEALYAEFLRTGKCVSADAETAFLIYGNAVQREILEALLLGQCPDEEITASLRVPAKSLEVYRELFFDPNGFRTELDRISYLEDYPDKFGRDLKMRAYSLGYEYVLYTYGSIVPRSASQKKLVQRMFMSSAYKAMNMNFAGTSSAAMRSAAEHGKLMLKAYETLEKINTEESSENWSLTEIITAGGKDCGTSEPLDGELV